MAQSRLQPKAQQGLTLTEMMIALSILALFILLANTAVLSRVQSYTFKSQIQDFISTSASTLKFTLLRPSGPTGMAAL